MTCINYSDSANGRGLPIGVFHPFLAIVPTLSRAGLSSNG
jgi:hypothetical protein